MAVAAPLTGFWYPALLSLDVRPARTKAKPCSTYRWLSAATNEASSPRSRISARIAPCRFPSDASMENVSNARTTVGNSI